MSIDYVPLLSGLIGAVIGALASVASIFISGFFENKRQLSKLAYEAALADHNTACELAKVGGPNRIAPLTSYIHFHVEYMRLLHKGKLSDEVLKNLRSENKLLFPSGAENKEQ